MISNESQYNISVRKFNELKKRIGKVKKEVRYNLLRNQLIFASLINSKNEMELEIINYENLLKK